MNIRELFEQHQAGRSYKALADRTEGALTAQRLQQIATTRPKEFARVEGVRAIAKALGVSELAVVLAYAESLGLAEEDAQARVVQSLPPTAGALTDDQLRLVTMMIRELTDPGFRHRREEPVPAQADEAQLQLVAARDTGRKPGVQALSEEQDEAAEASQDPDPEGVDPA